MRTVKVHNPATLLHIINGGRKMATARKPAAKKKTANRRPNGHTATTTGTRRPNTRRKNSVVILTPAQAKSAGIANPHHKRHTARRRSNPAVKGMIIDALWAWGGGIATNLAAGLIPIHMDGLGGIALRFGYAWGIGFLGEKVFGAHAGNLLAIGGSAAAAGELVNYAFGRIGASGTGLLNSKIQAQVGAGDQSAIPPPPGAEAAMAGYDSPNYMITDGMHGMGDVGDIVADPYSQGGMGEIVQYTM